jgi:hypothetical protein
MLERQMKMGAGSTIHFIAFKERRRMNLSQLSNSVKILHFRRTLLGPASSLISTRECTCDMAMHWHIVLQTLLKGRQIEGNRKEIGGLRRRPSFPSQFSILNGFYLLRPRFHGTTCLIVNRSPAARELSEKKSEKNARRKSL